MKRTPLHPLTHILVAGEIALVMLVLPLYQGLAVLAVWLSITLVIPARTETKLTGAFLKIFGIAAVFLFLLHGLRLRPPGISVEGMTTGLGHFLHIAVPVTLILYCSRRIKSEELFALLIDLKVPPVIIFILFRTLWLVPRFIERTDEVIIAQKLHGMRIDTFPRRVRALLPSLSTIISSMFEELSENSLTLSTRGFLQPGGKSHLTTLTFGWRDGVLFCTATCFLIVVW